MHTADIFARAGSVLTFGNGRWNLTIGGSQDTITIGNGAVELFDRYGSNRFTIGNGPHDLTLTGPSDTITIGTGRTTLDAPGGHDTIAIAGGTVELDAAGWSDKIAIGPALSTIALTTLANLTVSAERLGSSISESGVANHVTLLAGSDEHIASGLGGDVTTIVAAAGGDYRGMVEIAGLGADVVALQGVRGLSSFDQVNAKLQPIHGGWQVPLPGGGDLIIEGPRPTSANFAFTA